MMCLQSLRRIQQTHCEGLFVDQETLISELKKASDAGTGIVAMKTCFGEPYCCEGDAVKTFAGAVKWTLAQPYVHTSAVAMANFRQLEEHLSVNKS